MSNVTCKNCGAAVAVDSNLPAISCPYCQTKYVNPNAATNAGGTVNTPGQTITRITKTVTRQQNGGPVTTTTTTSGNGEMPDMSKLAEDMNKMAADMMGQFGNGDFAAKHAAVHKAAAANRAVSAPAKQSSGNLKGIILSIVLSFAGFALVAFGGIQKMSALMIIGTLLMFASGLAFIFYVFKAIFGK